LKDPNGETVNGETYGPMKALSEQYTAAAFKGRVGIVRPGYIVGPLDPSDRFTYWPVRASRGGEMLAPGTPRDPIQFIDVRDLAVWMMKLVGTRARGVFNATSPPGAYTMGDLLSASARATPNSGTTVTWVAEDFLAAHLKAEELDLPPWAPMTGDMAGASLTPTKNAERTGLTCRPVADTVRDTLTWFHSLPAERQEKLRVLIDPQKEADMLHAWHEMNTKG
jgi:2'-hydroxyisoflavone reductase